MPRNIMDPQERYPAGLVILLGIVKKIIQSAIISFAIFLIWTSIWYFGYAIHYDRLAKPLDKVSDQVAAMTTAGHTLEVGDHRIVLKHPGFLGEGGFGHVGPKEGMVIFLDEDTIRSGKTKRFGLTCSSIRNMVEDTDLL